MRRLSVPLVAPALALAACSSTAPVAEQASAGPGPTATATTASAQAEAASPDARRKAGLRHFCGACHNGGDETAPVLECPPHARARPRVDRAVEGRPHGGAVGHAQRAAAHPRDRLPQRAGGNTQAGRRSGPEHGPHGTEPRGVHRWHSLSGPPHPRRARRRRWTAPARLDGAESWRRAVPVRILGTAQPARRRCHPRTDIAARHRIPARRRDPDRGACRRASHRARRQARSQSHRRHAQGCGARHRDRASWTSSCIRTLRRTA